MGKLKANCNGMPYIYNILRQYCLTSQQQTTLSSLDNTMSCRIPCI